MYTQDECLVSPHHFTHLGICYEGDVAYIGISNPQDPQPVTFHVGHVPEPDSFTIFALGLAVLAMKLWRYRCH